jgi:two-component system response regulator HydG
MDDWSLPTTASPQTLSTTTASTFLLVVLSGPDVGKEFCIDGTQPSRVLIGQGPASGIRLSDRQVSRRHAALESNGDALRLNDLSSTNGTFVNGVAIFDAALRGGEVIRVGETALRVDCVARNKPIAVSTQDHFGRVMGASAEMRLLYPLCARLSATTVPVVIEGETGTGKELLAEAIHEESPRAKGPFVVFDCTAVPANLLESHLFGHERGAFTGAVSARRGVFEQAHGGTLLIDEIGDLDVMLQSKLLRAIERSEVQRVGGEKFLRVDVRVLAATRRDLDREVQAGRFRDDLFYRLAVARIELPPLRRRTGDVTVLGRYFWQRLGGIGDVPPDLLSRFEEYTWPGNIRELHNAVARRLALGEEASIQEARGAARQGASTAPPALIPSPLDVIGETLSLDLTFPAARQRVVESFERRYIERVLSAHHGNVAQAAAASGIARRYFYVLRARQEKP